MDDRPSAGAPVSRRSCVAGALGAAFVVPTRPSWTRGDGIVIRSMGPTRIAGISDEVQRIDYSGSGSRDDWALVRMPRPDVATWVVNLHGHGSHGDQLYTRPDIRDGWLPAFVAAGVGILTPNLRDNAWMCPQAVDDLRGLLAHMREAHGARRFLVVGGSMGGTSTLAYAALHPEDVAGAIALCPATDIAVYRDWCRGRPAGVHREIGEAIDAAYGGARTARTASARHSAVRNARRLTMPLYVAHGAADDVIPVSEPRRLVGAMAEAANLVYVEVPDGGHDSPLPLMASAFAWLLKRVG